jgi:alpha-beta hydrolase superfamily lysophospholipase
MDELEFRDRDGVDVFYRRWLPTRKAKLCVLIAHGMSEHSGRYRRVAGLLQDRGYAVYAPDHRGHGRTAKSTGRGRTGPSGLDGALADLAQLSGIAQADQGAVRTVLFGHSMGALLAQAYAERHGTSLSALVLSGSPGADGALRETANAVRQAVDSGLGDQPFAGLSAFNAGIEPARTAFEWLSRDPAEVDAYVADPWCGDSLPMTHGYVAAVMAMAARAMEPGEIARIPVGLPVLLLTGEADPVSNGGANVRALEAHLRYAGLAVDAIYYPGARHEVLNEVNREEVHRDLLAWLERIEWES